MIKIDALNFSINSFKDIVFHNEKVSLSEDCKNRIASSFNFLNEFIGDKVIYGINTGLGPMAQYKVDTSHQVELQLNLIRSHAAGIGEYVPQKHVKAAMVCRLVGLSKGYSGVNIDCLEVLVNFINHNIIPVVSEHGGVGASGDLVQLSQIALCLIGEGEVFYNDKIQPTIDVLDSLGISPLNISLREGLALINGTSFMTGVGIINYINSKKIVDDAILHGCLLNELVESFDDHFSLHLNQVKLHPSQQIVASEMRKILTSSKLIRKREDTYYKNSNKESTFKKKVQEYYSIRCLPQILGPILKTINEAGELLENELNSVSDNPIIDVESGNVYHGGNFHGDFVASELSKLKNAIIKLTVLVERQLNFLLNNKLNNTFTPFLNAGVLGLNLGLQGAQYAATSTTAENQSLSASVYVHSIPSNNDNQDVVSMGTNEAQQVAKVINNFFDVNSVFILALAQASFIKNQKSDFADDTRNYLSQLEGLITQVKEDKELRPVLEKIKAFQKLQ